jgi:hypothetical protein
MLLTSGNLITVGSLDTVKGFKVLCFFPIVEQFGLVQ